MNIFDGPGLFIPDEAVFFADPPEQQQYYIQRSSFSEIWEEKKYFSPAESLNRRYIRISELLN